MTGWVDENAIAASPAATANAANAPGSQQQQQQSCRAELAGSATILEDVGCSPTLLSSPRRTSRMSARTTSC